MSDYDLYVEHDHYHHIVDPDRPNYGGDSGDSSSYDDSPSSTDSSSDSSSYANSDTTPDNTCIDANHDGQCDATEMSPPDCEPCQAVSQDPDNGIADVGDSGDSGGCGGSNDCGGGSSDSGGSSDGSSST